MRRWWAIVVVLAVAGAACGGGDSSDGGFDADQQAVSDAIFNQIIADDSAGNPFGEAEARCFSDGVARGFTADELGEIGLSPADVERGVSPSDVPLTDAQADLMTDLMVGCIDFRALFAEEFANDGISADASQCLAAGFDDDLIRAMAKSELIGEGAGQPQDPAEAAKFLELITGCMSLDEITDLGD